MFKRLFGSADKASPVPTLAMVRNITVGRTVALDPLAWRRLGDETHFTVDRDALEITAQSVIHLDDGPYVHRFYTDDHIMLQAMSDDAEGLAAYDFTLFTPWSSAYPPGAAARQAWRERLSAPVFRGAAENLPDFPRFWFAESDATQPPVTLWETVYTDRAATEPYARIFQTCMLYARELGAGRELMLAIEQEPEGGEVTHEIMLGIPLDMAEFRA
jgi:hypothetical protein